MIAGRVVDPEDPDTAEMVSAAVALADVLRLLAVCVGRAAHLAVDDHAPLVAVETLQVVQNFLGLGRDFIEINLVSL